jgi:hypothetical protein
MLCIVVSLLSVGDSTAVLLDYQIGLDFASGGRSGCADRITNRVLRPTRKVHIHDFCQPLAVERLLIAFRIHRIFIVNLQLREGVAALPYTDILAYRSKRKYAELAAGGHSGPPLRRGFGSCGQLRDQSRHKKTTHALHRRFAFISGVSTADVIRLPN